MLFVQIETLCQINRELRAGTKNRDFLIENIEIADISTRTSELMEIPVQFNPHSVGWRLS